MARPRVTVLIPVLGRPQATPAVVSSVFRTSDALVIVIASPGDYQPTGDPILMDAMFITANWEPGPGDYARKLNRALQHVETEFVFQGASDLRFHPGWEEAALRRAPNADVIGTNDLCNPLVMRGGHSTHSLLRRDYILDTGTTYLDGPGVAFHEGYDHQYVDNELVAVARHRGIWAFAEDSHVEHLHPLCGKAEMDDIYMKALKAGTRDGRLYRTRQAQWIKAGRP